MESFGSFLDEEWESLSKMFSADEDTDHFSSHGLFSIEQHHDLNLETPSNVSSVMTDQSNNANSSFMDDNGFSYAYENINPNFYHYFSQENGNNAASLPYPSSNATTLPTNKACDHETVNIYDHENNINSSLLSQVLCEYSMEEILCSRQDVNIENSIHPSVPIDDQLKHTALKRKIEMAESQDALEDKVNDEKPVEKQKKKSRVSKDNKNNKKKVQPKKKRKVIDSIENGNENDGEDNNNNKVGNTPIASPSSCSSEDDLNGGAENSKWKTRAGRGAATDPQSLYARKRRERINERLKVLQNLVPNGTKVDISTMLEEAVQYVKFLQLQIKLLSSDEMWMYAPIAYNGMDMGLYQKLSHS